MIIFLDSIPKIRGLEQIKPVMPSGGSIWHALLILVASALLWHSEALSYSEQEGIQLIFQAWPSLGNLNPSAWNTSYDKACGFAGITCDSPLEPNSTITRIAFDFSRTTVTLPNIFDRFTNLTYFGLSTPGVGGDFLPSLTSLKKLSTLRIRVFGFTGTLPSTISECTSLSQLTISLTDMTGQIPPQLFSLPQLSSIDFASNKFGGTIPPEIELAQNLTTLSLTSNQIGGTIPPGLTKLKNLQVLSLGRNFLTGQIPDVSQLSNIIVLNVGLNHLTGTLPTGLSNMTSINQFTVANNYIGGTIPPEYLQKNVNLRLSNNLLTGTIPVSQSGNVLSLQTDGNLINICGSNLTWTTTASSNLPVCQLGSQDASSCGLGVCGPAATQCSSTMSCMKPCPLPKPTGVGWVCIHSSWTLFTSQTTLPGFEGSESTTIVGNINLGSLVLPSGGYIYFDGCPTLSELTLRLSPEELKALSGQGKVERLVAETACTTIDLQATAVILQTEDACYSVNKETSTNTNPTKLVTAFTVAGSSCGTPAQKKASKIWWIVVVAVVGGIVLIVAVIALAAAFSTKCRNAIMPYNRSTGRRTRMTVATPRPEPPEDEESISSSSGGEAEA